MSEPFSSDEARGTHHLHLDGIKELLNIHATLEQGIPNVEGAAEGRHLAVDGAVSGDDSGRRLEHVERKGLE